MNAATIIPAIVLLLNQPSPPPPSFCGLFPQPVTVFTTPPVTLRFDLAGLPGPDHVSINVTGPVGFITTPTSATCTGDICDFAPQFPWQPGNYQWTTRAIDPAVGCAGSPSLPQPFTLP